MVTVPISVGELIDKLSILSVKRKKISDKEKLLEVDKEFVALKKISENFLKDKDIFNFYDDLVQVNEKLWDVEDKIRIFEKNEIFDRCTGGPDETWHRSRSPPEHR